MWEAPPTAFYCFFPPFPCLLLHLPPTRTDIIIPHFFASTRTREEGALPSPSCSQYGIRSCNVIASRWERNIAAGNMREKWNYCLLRIYWLRFFPFPRKQLSTSPERLYFWKASQGNKKLDSRSHVSPDVTLSLYLSPGRTSAQNDRPFDVLISTKSGLLPFSLFR